MVPLSFFVTLKTTMNIPEDIPVIQVAKTVCQQLKSHGFEGFLIGGSIRDIILGIQSTDCDIASNAKPEDIESIFENTLPTGKRFGTITVLITHDHKKYPVQITTYRSEDHYTNQRHPDKVAFETSLDKDVKRRDFTCNALAYNPLESELHDYVGGLDDIHHQCLRVVGDAEKRFSEDSLRVWRCCRFLAQLQFTCEHKTWAALCECSSGLEMPAAERVTQELQKLMCSKKPSLGLQALQESGLGERILEGYNTLKKEIFKDCDGLPKSSRWAHVLTPIDEDKRFQYLRFSKKEKNWIQALISVGGDSEKARFSIKELAVTAKDIQENNIHGVQIGKMQKALLAYVLEDLSRNKKAILVEFINKNKSLL